MVAAASPDADRLLRVRDRLLGEASARPSSALLVAAGAVDHTLAHLEGRYGRLASALEWTRHALELSADSEAARFNEALILTSLGLCRSARAHWERFVTVFPASAWADEARLRASEIPCGREEGERGRLPHSDPTRRLLEALQQWSAGTAPSVPAPGDGDPLTGRVLATLAAEPERSRAAVDAYLEGRVSWEREEYAQAFRHYAAAEEILDGEHGGLASWIRLETAGAALETGRAEGAIARLDALRSADLFAASPAFAGHLEWKHGLAHARAGRLGVSIASWERAAHVFESAGLDGEAASMRSMQASAKGLLGLVDDAWSDRVRALTALRDRLPVFTYHTGLLGAATWAGDAGLHRAEAALLDEAASWGTELEEHAPVAVRLARARAFERRGRAADARRAFRDAEQASALLPEDTKAREAFEAAARLGVLVNSEGAASAARDTLRDLVAHFERFGPLSDQLRALALDVELARRAGDLGEARTQAEAALALVRRQHRDLTSEPNLRMAYWESIQEFFDVAIAVDLQSNAPLTALGTLASAQDFGEAELPALRGDRLGNALVESAARAPILVLAHVDRAVLWWKLEGGSVHSGRRSVPDLEDRVEDFLRQTMLGGRAIDLERELYDVVLGDALGACEGDLSGDPARLVVVPDRVLLRVPFAALTDEQGHRLVEHRTLSFASSVGDALRAPAAGERAGRAGWRIAAVGDPAFSHRALPVLARLPGAAAEVEDLVRIYGDRRVEVVSDAQATPDRVRRLVADSDLLHVAAHALPGARGWDDGLVLAAGEHGTGVTSANQLLAGVERVPRLVVLSACSSLGRYPTRGSGLLGLAGRFRSAGVEAVVGTLWPVPDDTLRRLLVAFHRGFAAGMSASAALRAAQLEATSDEAAGPSGRCCDWAALQIVGDVPATGFTD